MGGELDAGHVVDGGGRCGDAEINLTRDVINGGWLTSTLIGHGTLMFTFGGKVIDVLVEQYADYGQLPQGGPDLITHEHGMTWTSRRWRSRASPVPKSVYQAAAGQVPGKLVMANGEVKTVAGLPSRRCRPTTWCANAPARQPFHPQGEGNGDVITFGTSASTWPGIPEHPG